MSFDAGLIPGDEIDNKKLCEIFKCSPQGGMRRSKSTNTLVIVSNHVGDSVYEDRWDEDGIFHYTGMGMEGDQSLSFMQNKTLSQSPTNGIDVFLFEVFRKGTYTYQGMVALENNPYQEIQPDSKGNKRSVWMFPLRLVGTTPANIPKTALDIISANKEKKASALSDDELELLARHAPKKPGVQNTETKQYARNTYVVEFAKRRAAGHCQLCDQPAPFKDTNGNPFLETHHIVWLSRGGEDTIDNTVALCPNCHRKMHIVDSLDDRKKILRAVMN